MFDLCLLSQTEAPVFITDSVEASKENGGNLGLGLFSLFPPLFKIMYVHTFALFHTHTYTRMY